jgi:hypothetical protein
MKGIPKTIENKENCLLMANKKLLQTGFERLPPFLKSMVKPAVKSRILFILYGPHVFGYLNDLSITLLKFYKI